MLKRNFFFLLSLLVLVFASNIFIRDKVFWADFYQTAAIVNLSTIDGLSIKKPLVLVFVGDVMLDRGVEYMIKKYGNQDWGWPFLKIADELKEADILFGNLESVISDKGKKAGSIYSFRAEPEAIEGLVFAGFDVLSVANNHIFDYGREAMEDSFLRLKKVGIDYVGGGFDEKEAHSPAIKEIGETRIAYLAYTTFCASSWQATGGESGIACPVGPRRDSYGAWLDEGITEDVEKAKEKADIVVVSIHFGEEYQIQPNSEQIYFARLAIDSGADLVVGHHPHVVQPVEKYENGYIAYSLGNFLFDQGFSEETMKGMLLEVRIEGGKIKEVFPGEVRINEFFQPELAKD